VAKDGNGELVQRFGTAKGEISGGGERSVDFAGSGGIESRVAPPTANREIGISRELV
jgi:hypothetical protein